MKKLILLTLLLCAGCKASYDSSPSNDGETLQVPLWNTRMSVVRDEKRGVTCYVTFNAMSCLRDEGSRYSLPCTDPTSHDPLGPVNDHTVSGDSSSGPASPATKKFP